MLRHVYAGQGFVNSPPPSLNLNFLVDRLDPRITFTRTTTGTRTNSAGLIESVAINGPRFDYDPVTLVSKGLLIEEQRTNLLLNSAALSTQSVTVTAVSHTLSFYGTGTVTLSGTGTGTLVGTGAYPSRVTLTFTPTAGSLTVTVSGSVTSAQLEAGSFATSYIPTTTAQVTRAADVAVMTGTSFSSWYNQNEGTFFAQVSPLSSNYGSNRNIFLASDNTANNFNGLRYGSSGAQSNMAVTTAGVIQANIAAGALSAGTTYKIAGTYKLNDFAASRDAAAVSTDTAGTLPTVDRAEIGTLGGVALGSQHIRRIAYYPRRLSNKELQVITAA